MHAIRRRLKGALQLVRNPWVIVWDPLQGVNLGLVLECSCSAVKALSALAPTGWEAEGSLRCSICVC